MSKLYTVPDLARLCGVPTYTLNYAIDRAGIEPAGRVGNVRVWREEDLPAIRQALEQTAARSTNPGRRQSAAAERVAASA